MVRKIKKKSVVVNERGQRRMARLVQTDRKVRVAQIAVPYNGAIQKMSNHEATEDHTRWYILSETEATIY